MAEDRTITIDEISRSIDKGLSTADRRRAGSLERLRLVRMAKGASLDREQDRLTDKYGVDHPRVRALAARAFLNEGLVADLAVETVRARTEVPRVSETGWVLHGYVRDSQRNGVANLTVALYDQNANWVRGLGYGCTDSNGYFKIESTSEIIQKGISVYIQVLKDQELIYIGKDPLTPKAGRVDYREIALSDDSQVCGPPVAPSTSNPSVGVGRGPDGTSGPSPGLTRGGTTDADTWVVQGQVSDANGRGVAALIVTVYDKDLIFDDRLGQTETDEHGHYRLTYNTEDFRDLIEKEPDIYLEVKSKKRQTIFTSECICFEAGRVEIINIQIDA